MASATMARMIGEVPRVKIPSTNNSSRIRLIPEENVSSRIITNIANMNTIE